jgi:EmrB/QacA subfamily drug resistance transporter
MRAGLSPENDELHERNPPMTMDSRMRWLALYVLCLGDLMIVLDGTIVNVALPSIRDDLGFSQTSLAWVVNAYLLTFGGFLLLGGRLGDLFGHRRLFLGGIALFTLASLACGVANSQEFLVVARAVQGVGGAVVSAVALSLLMTLFTEQADRAKAMGVFGFVLSGGGVIGVLAGGILTDVLNWHWIFLVNLPVGVLVYVLSVRLLPSGRGLAASGRVDVAGAITVTASLMLAVYAIINGNEKGWASGETLGVLAGAAALLAVFLVIEARISSPLMPLGLFRNRNVSTANVLGVLMAAGLFAYFFFSALYLQLVLEYSPLEVGLAYLPGTVLWGASSLLLSDRLVMRFGIKTPLLTGLGLMTVALVLLARTPVDGSWVVDILPATLALGLGAGIAFNPLLLAAMSGVAQEQAGLASGVVNTAFMMGGAVGLAILASLADRRSESLRASDGSFAALNSGYHVAFLVGAVFVVASALVGAALLRVESPQAHGHEEAIGAPAVAEAD